MDEAPGFGTAGSLHSIDVRDEPRAAAPRVYLSVVAEVLLGMALAARVS
jgi:hypothetical protein